MKIDQFELDLLAQPVFKTNPFLEPAVKSIQAGRDLMLSKYNVVRFREQLLIQIDNLNEYYIEFDMKSYHEIASELFFGCRLSLINDIYACLRHTVPDITDNAHLISLGVATDALIWNTRTLQFEENCKFNDCRWISPFAAQVHPELKHNRHTSILKMLNGNEALYDNIMQSAAPLIMDFKPGGIIWWVGSNPLKHMLVKALHDIFPSQLSKLNTQVLTGRRHDYLLNEYMANVPIMDDRLEIKHIEMCKALASHHDRHAHRYHSQRGQTIIGNIHHIFIAKEAADVEIRWFNNPDTIQIVNFADGADVPTEKLNPAAIVAELIWYAKLIQGNNYRYIWQETFSVENVDVNPITKLAASTPISLNNW